MRSKVIVNGKLIPIIIDSGASVSLISDKLIRELNIPIIEKSNISFVMANGIRVASKGKVEIIMEINENTEIIIKVDVIESLEKELIIGNDILGEKKGIINYDKKILIIEENNKKIKIPIEYEENNYEDDDYYYSNSENENNNEEDEYENINEQEIYYYLKEKEKEYIDEEN